MLPSQGLMSELGVLTGRSSGTPLNFSPWSTFISTFFIPLQPTFTRRTSGHCLGTSIAANLALLRRVKCSVSNHPPIFLLSLSPSQFRIQRVNLITRSFPVEIKREQFLYTICCRPTRLSPPVYHFPVTTLKWNY